MKHLSILLMVTTLLSLPSIAQTTYDRAQDKVITPIASTAKSALSTQQANATQIDRMQKDLAILKKERDVALPLDPAQFKVEGGFYRFQAPDLSAVIMPRLVTLETSLTTLNNRQIADVDLLNKTLSQLDRNIKFAGTRLDNLPLTYATKLELKSLIDANSEQDFIITDLFDKNEALKKQLAEMQNKLDQQAAKFLKLAAALAE